MPVVGRGSFAPFLAAQLFDLGGGKTQGGSRDNPARKRVQRIDQYKRPHFYINIIDIEEHSKSFHIGCQIRLK